MSGTQAAERRDRAPSHETRSDAPWRLVPPAATPVRASDVAAAAVDHGRGAGRPELRAAIADRLGATSVATYTSFRRALGACLQRLAARSPDRSTVLVPAFASTDYPDAVEGVGLALDRYDVEADTLGMDVDDATDALDGDVLALVAVNALGYTSRMETIAARCEERDVALVEALGYALGGRHRDRPLGTFGDCAVLNFQEGKPIPVGGGMVASRRPSLTVSDAGRPAVRPNVATMAGYAAFARPALYGAYETVSRALSDRAVLSDRVTTHPGSKRGVDYEPPHQTMSHFQGALARRILARLPTHRRHRARTARFYAENLRNCTGIDLLRPVDGLENHQYVRFPILVDGPDRRQAIERELRAVGLQAGSLYAWPEIDAAAYPGAARLQRQLLALPTHPYVTQTDRRLAVRAVRAASGDPDEPA